MREHFFSDDSVLNMQVMQSGGCLEGLLSNAIQIFCNASILMAFRFLLLMSKCRIHVVYVQLISVSL